MNKGLPQWLLIILTFAFTGLGLMLFDAREDLRTYRTYFRDKSPDVSLRIGELSTRMDEAAFLKHIEGVPIQCIAEQSTLGDRVCYSSIDSADRLPALILLAFLKKGKLAFVIVHVPWWRHGTWLKSLQQKYGSFQKAGVVGDERGAVLRWTLGNGFLEMNQNRAFNPLVWSTVMWTGTPSH